MKGVLILNLKLRLYDLLNEETKKRVEGKNPKYTVDNKILCLTLVKGSVASGLRSLTLF